MLACALPLTGRRILVVEDEYLIATEVRRWLLAVGVETIGPVPRVDQALDLIAAARPDAAVLDVNLGDGDTVYPVADRLAAIGVPYLFATGDLRVADASIHQRRPRVEKPYLRTELMRALAAIVG